MQGFGGAQGLYSWVLMRQLVVAQKTVDAAVAGLAQLNGGAIAPALFAGHQVVAGGVLHRALAQAAAGGGGLPGTGSGFSSRLLTLLTTTHRLGQNK